MNNVKSPLQNFLKCLLIILANVTKPRSVKSENEINQLGLDFFMDDLKIFKMLAIGIM